MVTQARKNLDEISRDFDILSKGYDQLKETLAKKKALYYETMVAVIRDEHFKEGDVITFQYSDKEVKGTVEGFAMFEPFGPVDLSGEGPLIEVYLVEHDRSFALGLMEQINLIEDSKNAN